MVRTVGPVRIELTTLRLKAGYSSQLSYEPICTTIVAAVGFEPTTEAYETSGLTITPNHIW